MEQSSLNQYIQNGVLKDEVIIDSLNLNNISELKQKVPKILNQLNEDKTSIEKYIIYNLANLEMAMSAYQQLQNNKPEVEIVDSEVDTETENTEALLLSTIGEFGNQLESCQDDLTIVNKAIEIASRYIEK
jgi:hypothetical protein